MTTRDLIRSSLPLLATGLLLWGTSAGADVIGPPPTNCPAGTKAESCHGGPHCKPEVCVNDASCKLGKSCQAQQYCIHTINCGGGYGTKYVDVAKGTCPGGAPCKVGTCKTVKVCMAKAPTPDAKPPTPDSTPPTPDSKQPAPDTKQPAVDTKQSAVDTKQPAVDTKQPATDTKQPATDTKPATPADTDGCSCDLPAGGKSTWLVLLALALLFVSRRGRRA